MKKCVVLAALALTPLACGQLKLSVFDKLKAQASDSVNLNLGKDLLTLGSGLLGDGKGDAAKVKKLAEGLSSILIQSLEFEKEGVYSSADVQQIISEMSGPGWTLVLSADEKKEHEISRIWIKSSSSGELGGLRIMSAEPKELSVIEIIGKVSLKDLGDLGGLGLGIPNLAGGHTSQPPKKNEE
jgi:hypothetical protein